MWWQGSIETQHICQCIVCIRIVMFRQRVCFVIISFGGLYMPPFPRFDMVGHIDSSETIEFSRKSAETGTHVLALLKKAGNLRR
jgi:hypothetical protein